jgi:tRNA(Ile2) C34 agmatinyltransferase TiaS
MRLVKCEEPEHLVWNTLLCPKCGRTMRGGTGDDGCMYRYCSNCGQWYREERDETVGGK